MAGSIQTGQSRGEALRLIQRYEWLIAILVLSALFVLVSGDVAKGRFWAEEGTRFFRPFLDMDLGVQLVHLYHGQLQLWTNIAVTLGELAGLGAAPVVTTYFSGALIVAISAAIYLLRQYLGLSRVTAAILIALYWLAPQAGEVWASATNMQWHFGVLAALLLLVPASVHSSARRATLLACGLGGLPACLLAPVYLLAALLERSRNRAIEGVILLALAILQGVLITTLGENFGRMFEFDRGDFLKIFAAQIISPLIGGDFLNHALGGKLGSSDVLALVYAGLVFFALPLIFVKPRRIVLLALSAALFTAAIGYFGMPANDAGLAFSGSIAGRYFYTAVVMSGFTWLRLFESRLTAAEPQRALLWRTGLALVLTPLFYLHLTSSAWRNGFFNGPDWGSEVRDLVYDGDRKLEIWPEGWSFEASPDGVLPR